MSIQTIYKCDKCGAEQDTYEQFWAVGIAALHFPLNTERSFLADKSIQVCRPCLESFGIHVTKKPSAPVPKPPTVEELIREILQLCGEEE
jgi:hypothetical protein